MALKFDKEFPAGKYEFACTVEVCDIKEIDVYGTISDDYSKQECAQMMQDQDGTLHCGIPLNLVEIAITNTDTDESWSLRNLSSDKICPALDDEKFLEEDLMPEKINDNCYILLDRSDNADEWELCEEHEFKDGFKLSDIKFTAYSFIFGEHILSIVSIKDFDLNLFDAGGDEKIRYFIEEEEVDQDEIDELAYGEY